MRPLAWILAAATLGAATARGDETFDLMHYQPVPYGDGALWFSGAGSLGGTASGQRSYYHYYGSDADNAHFQDSAWQLSLQPSLQGRRSDDWRDLDWAVDLGWDYSQDHSTSQDADWNWSGNLPRGGDSRDSATSSVRPSLQWNGRWYPGPFQIGFGLQGGGSWAWWRSSDSSWQSSTYPTQSIYRSDYLSQEIRLAASGSAELALGVGRRRETRWGWDALELQRVLQEHGALKRPLSAAELQKLAELSARLGSIYAWDFQEQRLKDTQALASFFAACGALDPARSVDAVVILSEDYLLPLQPRLRGAELMLVLEEGAAYASEESWNHSVQTNQPAYDSSSVDSYAGDAPAVGLRWAWSRPLSPSWQLDLAQDSRYTPWDARQNGIYVLTVGVQAISSTASVSLAYIPSARWSWTLAVGAFAERRGQEESSNGVWNASWQELAWAADMQLAAQWQLASTCTGTLSLGWNWTSVRRWDETHAGATGPVWSGYVATDGQPYSYNSQPEIRATVSQRLF